MSIAAQRALFYATDSTACRSKNQTPPVPQRRKGKDNWQNLQVRFDDPHLTGRAGMPLVFLHERNLDMAGKLGRAIKLQRRSDAFRPSECSKFLIDTKIEGIERLYHLKEPRLDPVYQREYGLTELPCGKTMGQYLKALEDNHIDSLDRLNQRFSDHLVRKALRRAEERAGGMDAEEPAPPRSESWQEVIERDQQGRIKVGIDYDSSCMTVYGKQEESDQGRNPRNKDKPGFQPKFAFLAGLDVMIHQRLYPQSTGLGSGFEDYHRQTLARLPRGTVAGWVRGDGAIYSQDNVRMFERQDLTFAVTAQKTSHMWRAIDLLPEESWQTFEDENGKTVELAELYYKPATWPGPRRVFILSRRLKNSSQQKLVEEEKYEIYAYLTNYEGSLWERFKFCVGRCTVEKCIRESKLGFDWNHLPCAEFSANRAYLGHVQLAYNLMISFRLTALGGNATRWSADTVRRRLLAIPGRFSPRNPDILHLPEWWPHRHHLRHACRELTDFKA